jgi:hypothetical protein
MVSIWMENKIAPTISRSKAVSTFLVLGGRSTRQVEIG